MLLLEYQRFALECSMILNKTPEDAPKIKLENILLPLKKYIDEKKAIHTTMGGRKTFIIREMHIDDHKIVFLMQYADMDATDPSFTNIGTGTTRTETKKEGEGISVSAHLVLSRSPQSVLRDVVHDAILEEVPGLSKTVLKAGLNAILHECTALEFEHPESNRILKCRPLIGLDYNAGEKLEDLLKHGSVTGFVATRASAIDKLDEDGELFVSQERMEIRVKKSRGQKAIDMIKKARDAVQGREYTRLMIRYEGDDKRTKSLEVQTREQNIAEKFFAKNYKIDVEHKVEQCQDTIHIELVDKMVLLLNKMAKQP